MGWRHLDLPNLHCRLFLNLGSVGGRHRCVRGSRHWLSLETTKRDIVTSNSTQYGNKFLLTFFRTTCPSNPSLLLGGATEVFLHPETATDEKHFKKSIRPPSSPPLDLIQFGPLGMQGRCCSPPRRIFQESPGKLLGVVRGVQEEGRPRGNLASCDIRSQTRRKGPSKKALPFSL